MFSGEEKPSAQAKRAKHKVTCHVALKQFKNAVNDVVMMDIWVKSASVALKL